jgi:opacity protein-like surface antigen
MKTLTLTATLLIAAVTAPVAATHEVPLRGSWDAVETAVVVPPMLFVNSNAVGHASQLGRYTATFEFQVDLRTSTASGSFTMTAANGDTLFGTLSGHSTPAGSFAAIVETDTILGGTGRFAGATGSFTVERLLDQATGISSGSFNGAIALND